LSPLLCFGQVPGCLHITVHRAAPPESNMALFLRQEKIFIFPFFPLMRKKPFFFPWEIEKEGFCVGHE